MTETQKERISFLREQTLHDGGARHPDRIPFRDPGTIPSMNEDMVGRRAASVAWTFDHSPISIQERDLIAGTRTLLAANAGNADGHDPADYSIGVAMPAYINQADIDFFGTSEQFLTKTHYTPDYGILLQKGVSGIIADAEKKLAEIEAELLKIEKEHPETGKVRPFFEAQSVQIADRELFCRVKALKGSVSFLRSVITVWQAQSRFIARYAEKAAEAAKTERDAARAGELRAMAKVCARIATEPAETFYEAVQLFWFGHLGSLIESQEFINFGRIDLLLQPYLKDTDRDFAEELLACLMVKFYDQADLKCSYLGKYGGQITMTLGGITPEGENAYSETTALIMKALDSTRLTEPLVSFRVNSKNPPEFLEGACALSQKGLNTIGLYNDDLFLDSLKRRDIPAAYANNYGFGLCQDISIPGCDDNSMGPSCAPIYQLLQVLHDHPDADIETGGDFEKFYAMCLEEIDRVTEGIIARCDATQEALVRFRNGETEQYFEKLAKGEIDRHLCCRSLMTPLPYLSALFHGPVETGVDLTLDSTVLKTRGHYIFTPTVTVNSLVAIKYVVFDRKLCTMRQLTDALTNDFAGAEGEKLRQILLGAPKWGNDDDYADSLSVDCLEHILKTVQKHSTYGGGKYLAGIHQPHPVPTGKNIPATADGRHAGEPVSVTMTPSSGTLRNGPLAALRSSAKFDPNLVNWNYCLMLNYAASLFKADDKLLSKLVKAYFEMGGLQHQPNVCSVEEMKAAQEHPEDYPDLIVRLWGVSVRFIDIDRELQDEVIARFA